MTIPFKTLWAMALALLVLGCASHPRRVNCEGHLKPINAPAAATRSSTPP
jgi:hypothetical protein